MRRYYRKNRIDTVRFSASLILILIISVTNIGFVGALADEDIAPPEEQPQTCEVECEGTDEGDALIVTGDSQSEVDTENTVNTSVASTEEATSTPIAIPIEIASSTESATSTSEVQIENVSTAVVENEIISEAETGENTGSGGNATIISGDANASVNVINLVNTTITESNGLIALLNVFSGMLGDLDLREIEFHDACAECDILVGDLEVENLNQTTITNDVVVRAGTGENLASGGNEAIVVTGEANAAANVVNVANTNIVGSNYLLLAFNNFGDWSGDLILPSKYFFNKCCKEEKDIKIENENYADISNNVTAVSQTGDNAATGTDALVATGKSNSIVNLLTKANTNIYGSDSVYIAFRFFGDWSGNVFSLPEGFSWVETEEGLVLLSETPGDDSILKDLATGGQTTVSNLNKAKVENNVEVYALTGDNKASGGDVMIASGDASAAANVVNVVNTNVLGRNWVLALINIFGDWSGDIAFGRPDLWVGESVSNIPNEINPGHEITYTLTVINNGDTDATGVKLFDDFDERFLSAKSIGDGAIRDDGGVDWELGTLKPGEARVISYNVSVKDNLPEGPTMVSNTASVSAAENDNSDADNVETTSIKLVRSPARGYVALGLPDFKLSKKHNATSSKVRAGESIDYEIVLKNDGAGQGFESQILDELFFATGTEPLDAREWALDTVYSGEEIKVTYTLEISPEAEPGIYKNKAKFTAKDESMIMRYVYLAESTIEVIADIVEPESSPTSTEMITPEVLGAYNEEVLPQEVVASTTPKKKTSAPAQIISDGNAGPYEPVNIFKPKLAEDELSAAGVIKLDKRMYWPWLVAIVIAALILAIFKRMRQAL